MVASHRRDQQPWPAITRWEISPPECAARPPLTIYAPRIRPSPAHPSQVTVAWALVVVKRTARPITPGGRRITDGANLGGSVGKGPLHVLESGTRSELLDTPNPGCLVCLDMAKKRDGSRAPNTTKSAKAYVAWLGGVQDPRERYRFATKELERHQRAATRLSSVRASAAADAYRDGASVRALARQLGLSASRVHQLIHDADTGSRGRVE